MKWLLSLFGGGIYGYIIAFGIGAALFSGGTYYLVHTANAVEIADLKTAAAEQKAANVTAALTQLQTFIANMHGAVADYDTLKGALDAKFAQIERDFRNAIKANPLPLDCKPGAARVRSLGTAIGAVNGPAP